MRCRKARKRISEYVDGALSLSATAALEEHLDACPNCRKVLADLRAIAAAARGLEAPPVPEDAWAGIRARLKDSRRPLPASPKTLFGLPRPAIAMAALTLVLVAVGGVFVGLKMGRSSSAPSPDEQERTTLAKLDEAERHCELAIKALAEAAAGEKGRLSPGVAEMFARNVEVIDGTIQACRQAVLSEPDNVRVRDYLLAAYEDKIVLLDDLLGMNRKGAPGQMPGETL